MSRFSVLGLLPALAVSAACMSHRVEETDRQEFRFDTGSSRVSIEVRLEQGSVEITASDSSSVEAEFVKRARSVDSDTARALLERVEVSAVQEGERIRFEGRAEDSPSFAGDVWSDLKLRVPREADVNLEVGDGGIEVQGVSGEVIAETGDGRIEVGRITGKLRLRSGDGSIIGRELEAEVEASTDDGKIDLGGSFPRLSAVSSDGDIQIECFSWPAEVSGWVVRTSDGSISVTLPSSASASIDATTNDGRIVSRIPSIESEEGERRLRATLGGGGPLLLLSTMDGRIELREK